LELLIVIGIIGVLVALATVSYSSAQKSGRDSKRKQDMIAIQNALEQYYSTNSYIYPSPSCTVIENSDYMKSSYPVDPIGTGLYVYTSSCTTGSTYCVCAYLEKPTAGNSNNTSCTAWVASGGTHYCVGNLQ